MKHIQYNPQHMRSVASDCEGLGNEITFEKSAIENEINCYSKGQMCDQMVTVIQKTDDLVSRSRALVLATSGFIKSMANHLEEMDQKVANKI